MPNVGFLWDHPKLVRFWRISGIVTAAWAGYMVWGKILSDKSVGKPGEQGENILRRGSIANFMKEEEERLAAGEVKRPGRFNKAIDAAYDAKN